MRLFADENFPKPILKALRAGGYDAVWARTDLADTSGTTLLDLAESEARIVPALDKDFRQIAVQRGNVLEQSWGGSVPGQSRGPENLAPLPPAG